MQYTDKLKIASEWLSQLYWQTENDREIEHLIKYDTINPVVYY